MTYCLQTLHKLIVLFVMVIAAASHHSSWQGAKLKQLEMQRVIDDRATDGMFAKSSIGRMSAYWYHCLLNVNWNHDWVFTLLPEKVTDTQDAHFGITVLPGMLSRLLYLSTPTAGNWWCYWGVMTVSPCHSWWRWWSDAFMSDNHKVMTALLVMCALFLPGLRWLSTRFLWRFHCNLMDMM